jgi:hypothetical protein
MYEDQNYILFKYRSSSRKVSRCHKGKSVAVNKKKVQIMQQSKQKEPKDKQ